MKIKIMQKPSQQKIQYTSALPDLIDRGDNAQQKCESLIVENVRLDSMLQQACCILEAMATDPKMNGEGDYGATVFLKKFEQFKANKI